MRKRAWIVVAIVGGGLGIIALMVALLIGYFHLQERQRIADADKAFRPILHLGCRILSQPYGSRYCRYVLEFPPESQLSDENIAELESLNLLPQKNTLVVVIRTHQVTDKALPSLQAIKKFDLLVVIETAISDGGIEKLRKTFPDCDIPKRGYLDSKQESL